MYQLSDNQIKNYLVNTFKDTDILMKKQFEIIENCSSYLSKNLNLPIKNYDKNLEMLFEMLKEQQKMISNHKRFLILFDKYLDEDYSDYIHELEQHEFHLNSQIRGLSVSYIKKRCDSIGRSKKRDNT